MFFKKKEKQIDVLRSVFATINKELSVTLTQTYTDKDTGQKINKPATKNALVWIPTLLIEINQTLQRIERKLDNAKT